MTSLSFTLDGSTNDWLVVGFQGREAMNALYRFDVTVAAKSPAASEPERSFLRRATSLRIDPADGESRHVHGIVLACSTRGVAEGRPHLRFRVGPRVAQLRLRRTNRIFQDMTARQIIDGVLELSAIKRAWCPIRDLSVRPYCVQYEETDYAFILRLCREEGLFFSFAHAPPTDGQLGEEQLVFGDDASHYRPIEAPPLVEHARREGTHGADQGQIESFERHARLESEGVFETSYDLHRPSELRWGAASIHGDPRLPSRDAARTLVDGSLTLHHHEGALEEKTARAMPPRTLLQADRARESAAHGASACVRLVPGRRFTLHNHPVPEVDGDYVVTRVVHRARASVERDASAPFQYENHFQSVAASAPHRLSPVPRAVRQSLETATVVGPPNQDIHVDALGRVRVRFHWDLADDSERSSCWLRVAQAWAGAGWGSQMIPRVGMEVLVSFVGGDPDRPIVVGSLYNALNLPPFPLPEGKTKSGIRTRSSPRGIGANEILLDDQEGRELVSIRSQRDMVMTALGSIQSMADGSRSERTGGDHDSAVDGNGVVRIGGDRSTDVGGNHSSSVGGDSNEVVKGAQGRWVQGSSHDTVGGSSTVLIGGGSHTAVGTAGKTAYAVVTVNGGHRTSAVREIELESQERITLRVGETRLELRKDSVVITTGAFLVNGSKVEMSVGDGQGLRLDGAVALTGDPIVLSSSGASLKLDGNARLDGGLVHLGSSKASASVAGSGVSDTRGVARFEFKGIDPETAHQVTVKIAGPTGEILERVLDASCLIELEGRSGDRFVVVEVKRGDTPLAASAPPEDE